jgi:methylmalonyl-CoA carboxyltransferase small subunit
MIMETSAVIKAASSEGRAAATLLAAPTPVPPTSGSAPSNGNGANGNVGESPMAGVVVKINAQLGQQIQENDLLMVLEAMKMETNITAPVSGKIKAINVNPGDAVTVDQVVVEFE